MKKIKYPQIGSFLSKIDQKIIVIMPHWNDGATQLVDGDQQ